MKNITLPDKTKPVNFIVIFSVFLLVVGSLNVLADASQKAPKGKIKSETEKKEINAILKSIKNLSKDEGGRVLKEYLLGKYGDELVETEVDPSTGELTGYFATGKPYNTDKTKVDQTEALIIAELFVINNSRFPGKNIQLSDITYMKTGNYWLIQWNHVIKDAIAETDHLSVGVRDDGEVISFAKNWNISDKTPINPKISREEAIELAGKYLQTKSLRYKEIIQKKPQCSSELESLNNSSRVNEGKFTSIIDSILTVSESGLNWQILLGLSNSNELAEGVGEKYLVTIDAKTGSLINFDGTKGGIRNGFLLDTYGLIDPHSDYTHQQSINYIKSLIAQSTGSVVGGSLYSKTDAEFIADLKSILSKNIVYIDTHGYLVNPCWLSYCPHTEIEFYGNTRLLANEITNYQNVYMGFRDFIFIAACNSATLYDMSSAFIGRGGFKTYMGFSNSPSEECSMDFSKKFFEYAVNDYVVRNAKVNADMDYDCLFKYSLGPETQVSGQEDLLVNTGSIPGDSDGDGEVSLQEVITYINLWSQGLVRLENVIIAIDYYQTG